MYNKALQRIQGKVKLGKYRIGIHARIEMTNDKFSALDIENGIKTGKIVERQLDKHTKEYKYKIEGNSTKPGRRIGIIVKEKEEIVIITVFLEVKS